jgi:hypothetical protein
MVKESLLRSYGTMQATFFTIRKLYLKALPRRTNTPLTRHFTSVASQYMKAWCWNDCCVHVQHTSGGHTVTANVVVVCWKR